MQFLPDLISNDFELEPQLELNPLPVANLPRPRTQTRGSTEPQFELELNSSTPRGTLCAFQNFALANCHSGWLTTWRIDGGKSLWQELSMRLLRTLAVAWTEMLFLHKFALVYRLQRRMFFFYFLLHVSVFQSCATSNFARCAVQAPFLCCAQL